MARGLVPMSGKNMQKEEEGEKKERITSSRVPSPAKKERTRKMSVKDS